ncbi:hypothetical protein AOLI_G00158690 [Acnodon oligacanthus]
MYSPQTIMGLLRQLHGCGNSRQRHLFTSGMRKACRNCGEVGHVQRQCPLRPSRRRDLSFPTAEGQVVGAVTQDKEPIVQHKSALVGTCLTNIDEAPWLKLRAANGLKIPYVGYVLVDCMQLRQEWDQIVLQDGVLGRLHRETGSGLETFQIIPKQATKEMWETYHQNMGHPSSERTPATLRQHCYWPRMTQDVKE